ncbi:hypothetical protein ACQP1P_35130 [Dactylosporangium sp. CA-052675]|uniref:hypothetical protein n=1 Tax=Dactylosporangium sp. CA-052675 TaxID=3239927 RepID=UPI003D8DE63A
MVTWARVVLLQDHPRPYERVQAYRILTLSNPAVHAPRLARALGDLVDGFAPGAPHAALIEEAATTLRRWAESDAVASGDVAGLLEGGRNRRAADHDGPDWDLLAASLSLSAAGRGDAALAVAEELVECERRRRRHAPEVAGRLAVALEHLAVLLESRSRTATHLRAEAAALTRTAVAVRSTGIAHLLRAATPVRPARVKRAPAPSRNPMPMR